VNSVRGSGEESVDVISVVVVAILVEVRLRLTTLVEVRLVNETE
jgi:hypothetical protein